jgi:protocatechuate 3,4-dioxygenase alpha subunit
VTLLRTPSQTVGPFYAIGLCRSPENERVERGELRLIGQLLDGAGMPVSDGVIEIWDGVDRRWGRSGTDADGRFSFVASKPRSTSGAAPHFDVFVFARGLLRHQLTRIYFPDEEGNDSDPVLSSLETGDRQTLIAEQEDGALRFDIRLQGDRQTVFFAH